MGNWGIEVTEVIDSINNRVDLPKQSVNIFLVEEGEDDMYTFEIINISNKKREMLTTIVARAIKKINVQVAYMMEITYDDLPKIMY